MTERTVPARGAPDRVRGTARATILAVAATAAAALVAPAPAHAGTGAQPFPATIALPPGFPPESLATGPGHVAYVGNRVTGAVYRIDLATGTGRILAAGPGTPSLGVKIDDRWGRLFVAGGTAGDARVLDAATGRVLASYQLVPAGTGFVNDSVITPSAVYLTDSTNPVLYRLPLGRHGRLPSPAGVQRIPLTGALTFGPGINSNGIVRTPDGRGLVVVQTNTGTLFRVDPATGVTTRVDLGGESVANGDGLLLLGTTLYVVQNRSNEVAVIRLAPDGTRGRVLTRLTDPRFDTPTAVAPSGDRLYLTNARFAVPPAPDTPYTVVAIDR